MYRALFSTPTHEPGNEATPYRADKGNLRKFGAFFFFFFFFFSMKVYAKEQGIQDSIANGQYPNYKDTNRQNEKESNNKVKLMKVWI